MKLYGWTKIFRTFEMSKATAWSRNNEINFKEGKSMVRKI